MCHPCCNFQGVGVIFIRIGLGPEMFFCSWQQAYLARLPLALSQRVDLLAFSKVILGRCCSEVMKNRPFWV